MARVTKADAALCRAVAAWMSETVATDEQKVVDSAGNPLPSWEVKYPRIDSHTIYAVAVLVTLPEGISYDVATDRLVTGGRQPGERSRAIRLGARTVAQVEEFESQSVAGPKGAEPFAPDVKKSEVVFGGHELSAKLDLLLTGENAGGQFFGRGSAHRACVAHLAGQEG